MSPPERSSRMKVKPPAVPTPGIAGGENAKRDAFRQLGQFAVQVRLDGRVLFLGLRPLVPGLERHEEEAAVRVLHGAEQAEADDGRVALHAGRVLEDLLDFPARLVGPLERGGVGQLKADEDIALVLLGQEAARQTPAEHHRDHGERDEEHQAERALADEAPAGPDVAVPRAAEDAC